MIKNFNEFLTEKVSPRNGLGNHPERVGKEIAEFNEVLPDLIKKLPKKDGINYGVSFQCYKYEEHVTAWIHTDGKKQIILAEIEVDDLKDTDKLIDKITKEIEKL